VRVPEENAIAIFNAVDVGTPVTVFGRTPRVRTNYDSQFTMRRPRGFFDPRSQEKFSAPWWTR
jgi:hypothetical protein